MGIQTRVVRRIAALGASFILLTGMVLPAVPVQAADKGISTVSNKTVSIGEPAAITDLQITGAVDANVNVTIQASGGEFAIDDSGISATGVGSNLLTLAGDLEDINASLSTLTLQVEGRGTETITVSLGSNVTDVIIDPDSGRAYKIIEDNLTWDDARSAAAQLEYGGVQGYLANVTSEEEDAFIVANLPDGGGWIGASDYHADGGEDNGEGEWRWVDGPEAETPFWSGSNAANGGEQVGEAYNNWNWSEPNNSGDEDCAEYIVGEGWNDLNCNSETRNYVVEFGAGVDVPDPIERTFTVTSVGATHSISTCDQLFALGEEHAFDTVELTANIDCGGRTEESLFEREDFGGIFNGNGFTLKNLNIQNEDNDHAGLTGYSDGAEWRNLFIDNVNIIGQFHCGILAGHVSDSIIAENIHITNSSLTNPQDSDYKYASQIGMLFGRVSLDDERQSRIEHVSVQGEINFEGVEYIEGVGGIVGQLSVSNNFMLNQAYADVDIKSSATDYTDSLGGLVGSYEIEGYGSGSQLIVGIENAYGWGSITDEGAARVGGLVGEVVAYGWGNRSVAFAINNSYSWMDIKAGGSTGGLIGYVDGLNGEESLPGAYEVNNSFFAGSLDVTTDGGTIIGLFEDEEETLSSLEFDNVWYDADKAGDYDCVSNVAIAECSAANGDGSQPNYFLSNTVNAPMDTWNFSTIWKTNANTPPVFKPFIGNDGDQDGANDYIESRAPNNGDGNNDGTQDDEQANVASFVNPETSKYITLALDEACSITEVSTLKASNAAHTDAQYTYANGLVSFSADCGEAGFVANVTLYYHGVHKDGLTVRKYNSSTGEYFTISSASLVNQEIAGQTVAVVSYEVADGGELDVDGTANGTIVDPVGLGGVVSGATSQSNDLASTGTNTVTVIFVGLSIVVLAGALILVTPAALTARRNKT